MKRDTAIIFFGGICFFLLLGCVEVKKENPISTIPESKAKIPADTSPVFQPLSRDFFGLPPKQPYENITNSIGPQRVGVILYRYPNVFPSRTPEEMQNDIFDLTNPCSFNYFLLQTSNGRTWLISNGITPWMDLPFITANNIETDSIIPLVSSGIPADPIAAADKYLDYTTIDRLFIIGATDRSTQGSPGSSAGLKQTVQTAEGERSFIIINANYDTQNPEYTLCSGYQYLFDGDFVLAHEYGHSLTTDTIDHAGIILCGSDVLTLNGKELNEGCSFDYDPLDQLGTGIGQYNSIIKEKVGWLSDSQIEIVKQSGIYILHPAENQDGSTTVIKIPRVHCPVSESDLDACGGDGIGFYYLEYHRLLGKGKKSQNNQGIQIRIDGFLGNEKMQAYIFPGYLVSNLLNLHSIQYPHFNPQQTAQYTLNSGETFTDPFNGTTITPISITDQEAKIQIEYKQPLLHWRS